MIYQFFTKCGKYGKKECGKEREKKWEVW